MIGCRPSEKIVGGYENKMNKIINIVLLLAVTGTGFSVVTVRNELSQNFIELDKAQKQESQLEQDYARLKLEQARLANHKLVKMAAEKQELQPPTSANTVMVERRR